MNKKDIILMAQKAQFFIKDNEAYSPSNQEDFELTECLERFATLVASAEREACADIADKLPRTYRETKEAHERATLEPFHPSRFGFDFAEMRQAEVITHTIRARGQA